MSVKVSSWVWEYSKTTGNDRLLLLAIADNADDDGDNAWPSVETLADKATCSERTVQRRIQKLEEEGCLTVTRGAGRNGTHRYRVHMDDRAKKPEKPARTRPAAGEKAVDNPPGGDKLSPPGEVDERGDKLSPGVTQLCRPRGDTQVSPERPERPRTTPPTPASRGARSTVCSHGAGACRRCGTNPRALRANPRAVAAAEDVALAAARAAVPHCGHPDCNPANRWHEPDAGRAYRCPDCHPDLVVGRTPALALVGAGSGRPDPGSRRVQPLSRAAPRF